MMCEIHSEVTETVCEYEGESYSWCSACLDEKIEQIDETPDYADYMSEMILAAIAQRRADLEEE